MLTTSKSTSTRSTYPNSLFHSVQGYKTLQLQYFFTAGPDEVKAWTILKGTKAPQAAGRIHTDFEKGFIMAEVSVYTCCSSVSLGSIPALQIRIYKRQVGLQRERKNIDISYFDELELRILHECLKINTGYTMERLEQGRLHPKLEVPRLTCTGQKSNPGLHGGRGAQ